MNEDSELTLDPFGGCPACNLRRTFKCKAATGAYVPLSLLQDGYCSKCLRWLAAQTGRLVGGALDFEKQVEGSNRAAQRR